MVKINLKNRTINIKQLQQLCKINQNKHYTINITFTTMTQNKRLHKL